MKNFFILFQAQKKSDEHFEKIKFQSLLRNLNILFSSWKILLIHWTSYTKNILSALNIYITKSF